MGKVTEKRVGEEESKRRNLENENKKLKLERENLLEERAFLLEEKEESVRITKRSMENEKECRKLKIENEKLRYEKDQTLQEVILNTHTLEEEFNINGVTQEGEKKVEPSFAIAKETIILPLNVQSLLPEQIVQEMPESCSSSITFDSLLKNSDSPSVNKDISWDEKVR